MDCRTAFGKAAGNALSFAAANTPDCKAKSFFLSTVEFFEGLNGIAPPPDIDSQQTPKRLRDAEFVRVAEFCAMYGKEEWSLRPRTLIVLHFIGCMEAIEEFAKQKYSDLALPYTAANLPKAVRGEKARNRFLDFQNYVLTAHAKDLEKAGEPHQNVEGSADEYFIKRRELGRGSFGQVDHVVGRLSIDHFARKRIPRGKSFKRDQQAIKSFQNELTALKTLSHRHLVKLVSSYTDRNWVGLIMKPVAEYNFEYFLSAEDIDQIDRQTCIRRFFGCLATAVEYLHQNQIRHKDIKPANILVDKDRTVLLTDFGTSHNWGDDTRSSSNGTSMGFTKRYCAPEVADCASRNQSSDVWSLGCVFLEMGTVLNGRTVSEMRSYFDTHGTQGPYVRGNREASSMWLKELSQGSKCIDDMQPLHLSLEMCHEDPDGRLTAGQVLSEILDFQGDAPYCGHCCDGENGTLRPMDNDLTERGHFPEKNAADDSVQSMSEPLWNFDPALMEASAANVAMSAPQDLTEPISNASSATLVETTSDKGALSILPGFESSHNVPSTLARKSFDTNPVLVAGDILSDQSQDALVAKGNWQPPTVEDYEGTMTVFYPESLNSDSDVEENEMGPKTFTEVVVEISAFDCEWPSCHATSKPNMILTFASREELKEHYRSRHLVHEFGSNQIVATRESATPLASQTDRNTCLGFVLKNLPSPPSTGKDNPVQHKPQSDYSRKKSSAESERLISSSKTSKNSGRRVRFSDPYDIKQPEITTSVREVEDVRSNYNSITPESLEEPVIPTSRGPKKIGTGRVRGGVTIPKSSMVPSYYLAASNQFTRQEIDSLIPPARFSAFMPPPLFVYGSLMFPSILRARAEQFTGAEGIYSERYQRRLKTDSSDWSRINFSLQNAAEKMTPGRLDGYQRFKPHGLTNAAISEGTFDSSVQGFVLFGLSEEALKCFDHLFSGEESQDLYGDHNFEEAGRPALIRRHVEVVISVKGGDDMTVNTVTYQMGRGRYDSLDQDWDINKFVRSNTFTKLSGARQGSFWMEEETRLASTMGMSLVLSGDMLGSAVLRKDKDKLLELLDDGHDANAPCTYHGSPLAAAAFKGRDDFVELLIRYGADVNATGGEYHTPLIAATVQGHDECVRALIKAGADILAHGGKYISAIYQAVDFGDADLAKMLLEKGAWLTKEYRELLDLSAERGNRIMVRMIEDYDVRQLYLLPGPEAKSSRRFKSRSSKRIKRRRDDESEDESDLGSEVARRNSRDELEKRREPPTPLAVVRAVGLQALYLKGQRGKWTGIKGVKILRAAFDAGIPESILDKIRPHLSSYQNLVDFLGRAMVQYEEEQGDLEPSQPALSSGSNDDLSSTLSSRVARPGPIRKSVSDPQYSESSRTERGREVLRNSTDDAFCLTCDGRGGRRGTGRKCTNCRGAGTFPTERGNRVTKCKSCSGSGLIFANRDRCRACNGINPTGLTEPSIDRESTIPDYPPPPYSSVASLPTRIQRRESD